MFSAYKFHGNWRGVEKALENMPKAIHESAKWGKKKAAQKLVKLVKDHINAQDLGWQQRSSRTNSSDPRILVDNEEYYNAIKVWSKGGEYYAGVPRDKYNREGTRISDIALIHEFGSGDIPARPVWQPSFEEMGGSKGVQAIILEQIHRKLKELKKVGFDVN